MDKKSKQLERAQTLILLTVDPNMPSYQCSSETERSDAVIQ